MGYDLTDGHGLTKWEINDHQRQQENYHLMRDKVRLLHEGMTE